jgi:hypothetical protein
MVSEYAMFITPNHFAFIGDHAYYHIVGKRINANLMFYFALYIDTQNVG